MANKSGARRNPTQADVAHLAGVSQALISYVVNDNAAIAIPEATRRRIDAAIEQLGYVPDSIARSLRTRKTLTIAAVIPDITNPFYSAFQRGIQDVSDHHGYDLLTYNTDSSPEKEARCLRLGQQGRVDGLIVVLFHHAAAQLRDLVDRGVAVVRLEAGRKEAGDLPIDNVYIDNDAAAHTIVTYLINQGHRRIGMIGGPHGPRPARALGYLRALAEHGIAADESLVHEGNFQESGGRLAMQGLLSLAFPPTAVFAINDLMAIGAINAIKDAGLRIPDDIAVAGFDNIPAAQFVRPPLTTIAHYPELLGSQAAEMLFERLHGTAPDRGRCDEMPYQLVVRDSA